MPPASIVLDPSSVNSIERNPHERLREIRDQQRRANLEKIDKRGAKKKQRGRNKISKRLKKVQETVVQARKLEEGHMREERQKTKDLVDKIRKKDSADEKAGISAGRLWASSPLPDALKRFMRKK
ncbi:unnamed protein product [Agarophyton chilense]